jgi:large conductance mechanosensitive channel
MSILKEFKQFALKGSVVELAVGIIIGASFGKIVTSFVTDVIMPPLGLALNGVNFTDIKIILKHAVTDDSTGKEIAKAVTLNIGNFIQTFIDLIIVAFALFMIIKATNKFTKKAEEAPKPTKDQELLMEIRDLLKNKQS